MLLLAFSIQLFIICFCGMRMYCWICVNSDVILNIWIYSIYTCFSWCSCSPWDIWRLKWICNEIGFFFFYIRVWLIAENFGLKIIVIMQMFLSYPHISIDLWRITIFKGLIDEKRKGIWEIESLERINSTCTRFREKIENMEWLRLHLLMIHIT